MIDTIALTLTKEMFIISEPDKFKPSAKLLTNLDITAKQNPTQKELRSGIYKPRLTISQRFNATGYPEIMLKVELSLPKLLFGNNFNELQYKDFLALTEKLVAALKQMGIITTAQALSQAPVSAVHYSKNIVFTDGVTPYHFINKIKEANIKLSLDVNQTEYRDGGHGYKWHCNSYEVAFYDKIKDLEKANKSSKRALEKDSALQTKLMKDFEKRNKFEVLRIEVRLNKRQKIKQLFKNLGITADLTFKKLFKPAISKKILLHYLDELESRRPTLLDYKIKSDKGLLVDLIFNNPSLKPRQILQIFGLRKALEVVNLRELRSLFSKHNQRSWYRLIAELSKVTLPTATPFASIRKQLMRFKSLKLN